MYLISVIWLADIPLFFKYYRHLAKLANIIVLILLLNSINTTHLAELVKALLLLNFNLSSFNIINYSKSFKFIILAVKTGYLEKRYLPR